MLGLYNPELMTNVRVSSPSGPSYAKVNPARERLTPGRMILAMPFVFALFATTLSPENTAQNVNSVVRESSYRTFLFGAIYLLALGSVLFRVTDLRVILRGSLLYSILLGYTLISAIWSNFPLKVLITWGHFAGIFLVALAAVIALQGKQRAFLKLTVSCVGLAVLASIVTAMLFPARGIMEIGGKLRWVGLTASPNTLGLAALVLMWASLSLMSYIERFRHKVMLFVLMAASAAVLYMANSIAAASLSLLSLMLIPLLTHISNSTRLRAASILLLTFVMVVAGIFVVYLAVPDVFQLDRILAALGRDRSLTGRTGLWEIANSAIREKPALGWGFDALMSLGSKYRISYGQFHNGYLDLLVRGGWIGMLLVAALIVQLFSRILRVRKRDAKAYAAFMSLLVIILLHNFTEASLARSPHIFWLLFTFSYFYVGTISRTHAGVRAAK